MFRNEAFAALVGLAVHWLDEVVEFGVEHTDDFTGFVVDYCLGLFVPESGDGVAAFVLWIGLEVQLLETGEPVERVTIRGAISACEEPAVLSQLEICVDHLNHIFEVL